MSRTRYNNLKNRSHYEPEPSPIPAANKYKSSKGIQPKNRGTEGWIQDVLMLAYQIARGVVLLSIASVFIFGTAGLAFVDIAAGTLSFGSVWGHEIALGGLSVGGAWFSMGISYATSLVQLGGWMAIERKEISKAYSGLLKGVLLVVVFIDTYWDVSVLNMGIYGESVLDFNPFGHGPMFLSAVLLFAIFTAAGERLIVYFLGQIKNFIKTGGFSL